jgi:hydroxymethylglutaryl-CoA lyase
MWPKQIEITEVGPRDGLQNQAKFLTTSDKIDFINALSLTGLKTIEVSAFVHPKWIPQLADADEVFAGIDRNENTKYMGLVPNDRGWLRALAAGVDEVSVVTAATETFCLRNTNTSVEGALKRIVPIVEHALSCGIEVRGYISCVIACPYEGVTDLAVVRSIAKRMLDMGVGTIALGETIGVAKPDDIKMLYEALDGVLTPEESVLHLHDTHGRALECAREAMHCGVVRFDSSAGGLGGCPYAPGAAGNFATEDLVFFAHQNGINTGIDFELLAAASRIIEKGLDCNLQSKAYRAFQESQTRPRE